MPELTSIELLAHAIATITRRSYEETLLELRSHVLALSESDGACERLFNIKMRQRNIAEFSEWLAAKL